MLSAIGDEALKRRRGNDQGHSLRAHLTITTSGLPFSTMYVPSSAPLPLPTFFAEWTVPAGMNKT